MKAVVFDMDGVLVDSEPAWRVAEQEWSDRLGLGLTDAHFERTMGLRMADAVALWMSWSPWEGPSVDEVAGCVTARVAELLADASPLPGVKQAIAVATQRGLQVGLCSSSSPVLIGAVVDALGLADAFTVCHSASEDAFGKPHPEPYLQTAAAMGVDPRACIAVEDSLTGALAAKAAQMRVIAVPTPEHRASGRFGFADAVLTSLEDFDTPLLDALDANVRIPSLSLSRFHLAFPVDDLEAARAFYGTTLGCTEGRSSSTWIDFDFFGHQLVAHLDPHKKSVHAGQVDGHAVPAEHFGVLLTVPEWRRLATRLEDAGVPFLMDPVTRFAGLPGEQSTFFVLDPAGNALEFKAFVDDRQVFASD